MTTTLVRAGPDLSRRALCLGLLSAAAAPSAQASDDALRLMQRVHDRPTGRDVTTAGRMELVDRSGSKRVREIVTYRVERAKGDASNLVRFLNPPDIAGVGLLSVDKPDGSNEQWLYLPELDRVRRVASERKGGRFVASDIYFEDLQTRKPASDNHRLLGKETLSGIACDIVESIPVDPTNSVYRKRLQWVDPQLALVMRMDFFERNDTTPSKRWQVLSRKEIQGIWTVTESRTTDLGTGHETRLHVDAALYDRKLPAKLFTSQSLSDDSLESRYRP